ncbi:MAG: reverse transcriptase-like protein, partial [Sciscionella sp.]
MTGARHVILEADGGSRGNPGPAGYGAALRDTLTGDLLVQRSGALEHTTNNVAEYTALLEGLRAAKALGAVVVEVRMDSKLVVEQMSGRWKIRNASLRALADEARNLAAEFDEVSYEWIPRERNTVADRLANEAMDERVGATVPAKAAEPAPIALRESPARDSVSAPGAQTAAPASWSGSQGVATRLVLLRHGQTEYSV